MVWMALSAIAVLGLAPMSSTADVPAPLQAAITHTIAVSSCEIGMRDSIAGSVGTATYQAPGSWLGPRSANTAGGLIVGDREYAVVTDASGLRVVSSGPISKLSESNGLTPAQLTAFNLLLAVQHASKFTPVKGGWTFTGSRAVPAVRSGSIYLSGGRVVNLVVDELDDGKLVRLEDRF